MSEAEETTLEYNITQYWDDLQVDTFSTANISNETDTQRQPIPKNLYTFVIIVLFIFMVAAIIFNLVILLSTRWLRRKISPTLKLSLSMTTSDSFSLIISTVSLTINSLFPNVLEIELSFIGNCSRLSLEWLRSSGMLSTIFHVFALAGNNYIGVQKPLHYNSFMTHRTIYLLIFLSWFIPPVIVAFAFYFFVDEDQGFRTRKCNTAFTRTYSYRIVYSVIVSTLIVLIVIIYLYIYILIKKNDAQWTGCSRTPSQPYTRGQTRSTLRRSKRRCKNSSSSNTGRDGGRDTRDNSNDEGYTRSSNDKAIRTTILIVGSLVVGWTPVTLYFATVCDVDCIIRRSSIPDKINILINFLINFLMYGKTAVNSCIYAARMQDIKRALDNMSDHFVRRFCRSCSLCRRTRPTRDIRLSRLSSRRTTVVTNNSTQEQPLINGIRRNLSRKGSRHREDTSL